MALPVAVWTGVLATGRGVVTRRRVFCHAPRLRGHRCEQLPEDHALWITWATTHSRRAGLDDSVRECYPLGAQYRVKQSGKARVEVRPAQR
jgi:hypothetical protein